MLVDLNERNTGVGRACAEGAVGWQLDGRSGPMALGEKALGDLLGMSQAVVVEVGTRRRGSCHLGLGQLSEHHKRNEMSLEP